jgi:hypothetical protein
MCAGPGYSASIYIHTNNYYGVGSSLSYASGVTAEDDHIKVLEAVPLYSKSPWDHTQRLLAAAKGGGEGRADRAGTGKTPAGTGTGTGTGSGGGAARSGKGKKQASSNQTTPAPSSSSRALSGGPMQVAFVGRVEYTLQSMAWATM